LPLVPYNEGEPAVKIVHHLLLVEVAAVAVVRLILAPSSRRASQPSFVDVESCRVGVREEDLAANQSPLEAVLAALAVSQEKGSIPKALLVEEVALGLVQMQVLEAQRLVLLCERSRPLKCPGRQVPMLAVAPLASLVPFPNTPSVCSCHVYSVAMTVVAYEVCKIHPHRPLVLPILLMGPQC